MLRIGDKNGSLTLIKYLGQRRAKTNVLRHYWRARCDCGGEIEFRSCEFKQRISCGCARRKPRSDLSGKRFGRLVVLGHAGKRGHHVAWRVRCDCGNEVETLGITLKAGQVNSCGCLRDIEDATSERAFKYLFWAYRGRAKNKAREFSLTQKEFRILTKQNCFYCNAKPAQRYYGKICRVSTEPYIYNGIDRLKSEIGYVLENCVPCCGFCNKMKLNHSVDAFMNQINKIYKYQQGRV